MLNLYKKSFSNTSSTLPAIMDEASALECVTTLSHIHVTSLQECESGALPNIFLYEKQEDKKHLSIEDVRRFLRDIAEKPYEGKAIYLLSDFDEATPDAMNAMLKILEEPPQYAIIILIVANPEALIETVRSRCLIFFRDLVRIPLTEEKKKWIGSYFS